MKFSGLTDREVEHSRQQYGSNAIPDSQPTTFWEAFKETFGDPMIRILLIIAGLMIVMWVLGYADIYEPAGTIVAVLIVAFVSAKTSVASDTKYRELKGSTKKDQCMVYRNGLYPHAPKISDSDSMPDCFFRFQSAPLQNKYSLLLQPSDFLLLPKRAHF